MKKEQRKQIKIRANKGIKSKQVNRKNKQNKNTGVTHKNTKDKMKTRKA